jgi:Tfp pilus assembly protein PilF
VLPLAVWLAASGDAAPAPAEVRVLEVHGRAEILAAGAAAWRTAQTNQTLHPGDGVRTGERSHLLLRWTDLSLLRVGPLTEFTLARPAAPTDSLLLSFLRGIGYFFSRERPGQIRFHTRTAAGAVRGTEFVIEVDDTDRLVVTLLDGEVELSNALGAVNLASGEQGVAEPGRAPAKTAVLDATSVIQWLLYYPAVLDAEELPFSDAEKAALAASLTAYREGDLRQALARYPLDRQPASAAERVYRAGLLLSVGRVSEAENELAAAGAGAPLAEALREVVAAAQFRAFPTNRAPATASEWLARSLYQQKDFDLAAARASAQRAVALAPGFGFGWARLAELEFSFGRLGATERALDQALRLAPRHAQARALRGFVLAAQNRIAPAVREFDEAIALDGALGNAWLGRGLCRLRRGDRSGGLADLQAAAALEPNRALLRSYLGKAFSHAHDSARAERELARARQLDPADPTAWLYAALLHQQLNRVNEGVRDLERSLTLNDHRRVYRSRLLLDQDRAVRSASLATIYQRAGMTGVSVREAARAVSHDYANHSAHQFLAESFNALRDPTRFNLRFETAWFHELLLASLLAPVGAGQLSQNITYQEYSKLFTTDGAGLTTDSLWRSDGQFFQLASQFGTFGNTSYALDLDYQHNDGVRPNNRLARLEWYTRVKQQLTPQDSVMLLAKYQDYRSGDNFQYQFTTNVRRGFRYEEFERPILLAAYHREWAPGVHTLLLGGRLHYDQRLRDTNATQLALSRGVAGQVTARHRFGFDVDYRSEFEAWTSEWNQIFHSGAHTLVFGARFQGGELRTSDRFDVSDPANARSFIMPAAAGSFADCFERASGYGYYTVEPFRGLRVTAGVAYDVVTFPATFRNPPVRPGTETRAQLSPKSALVWSPRPEVTFRAAYTRSLGGVTLDESYRLEPAQLAGFVQSYRTLISESLVGSVSAPAYETLGAAVDLKFPTRTYVGLEGEWRQQQVRRTVGVFDRVSPARIFMPSTTPEALDYDEKSAGVTVNQLLGDDWAVGAGYRFTRAKLHAVLPEIPVFIDGTADTRHQADLHEARLFGVFNHPAGWFAHAESHWFIQRSWTEDFAGSTFAARRSVRTRLPDETFPLVNLFVGYRFPRQYGDLSVGVLNLTGQDYQLNPLNVFTELPRERTLAVRARLVF